jgi:hypothetical protein
MQSPSLITIVPQITTESNRYAALTDRTENNDDDMSDGSNDANNQSQNEGQKNVSFDSKYQSFKDTKNHIDKKKKKRNSQATSGTYH